MEDKKQNRKKGQAMLLAVMLFLASSLVVSLGLTSSTLNGLKTGNDLQKSKESFSLGESLLEDITYRLKAQKQVSDNETLSLNNYFATSSIINIAGNEKLINVSGNVMDFVKNIEADVVSSSVGSFNYGIQTGQGGITMSNSSSVVGNLYSSGPIIGTGSGNVISAVSAGANGIISGLNTTEDAHAHTIESSNIGGDAYYQVKRNTNVSEVSYPNSSDMPALAMPISDDVIAGWESDAQSGGVINSPCPYSIYGSQTVTLGPVKINCDLNISNSAIVKFAGAVWVSGNINISNSSQLKIDPSLSGKSIPLIADKQSNRTSSSIIYISNGMSYSGSGGYLFLISKNNSAQNGGSSSAIDASNTVRGDIALYAPNGLISISNSVNVVEVTGYKVNLSNSATINYQRGVASPVFVSGPSGGGYSITNWGEK